MTPRLVSPVLAAALLVAGCSSSDDAATTEATEATSTGVSDDSTTTGSPTTDAPATTVPATTTDTTTDTATDSSSTTQVPADTTPTTTETPAETTTTTTDDYTAAEEADRTAARTALITLSVFPDGWVEDPVEDDDDDGATSEFEAEFDTCLGRDGEEQIGDRIDRLKVSTGDFHPADDDSMTVSHEVVLAPDVDTALEAMAEVRIDGAEQCLADVIGAFYRSSFADDPELADVGIGDVIVTRTETDRDPDLMLGVLLEVPLTIGEQTVSQFLELLYQRQGRALSELSFSSFGGQFDRDGYTVLSDEAIIRLATIGN